MVVDNISVSLKEGSLTGLSLELKQALSRSLRGFDRKEIAEQVTKITGKGLSKAMLDKMASSNPDYQADVMQVLAICEITGKLEPFTVCLRALGAEVVSFEDKQMLDRLEQVFLKHKKLLDSL